MSVCGDKIRLDPEQCDDGGLNANDGCSKFCTIELGWTCRGDYMSVCTPFGMDGVLVGDEECDDCNNDALDGCGPDGKVEPWWECLRWNDPEFNHPVHLNVTPTNISCPHRPSNLHEWGYTTTTADVCRVKCGDGLKHTLEACDDGNLVDGDGCNRFCEVEPYFKCAYSLFSKDVGPFTSVCEGICGDGVLRGSERCEV